MMFPTPIKRLWVDFNDTYDGDYIWTSLRQASSVERPEAGEWVELYDDDDEKCRAIVSKIDGPIVHCKIDWSTWSQVEFHETEAFPTFAKSEVRYSPRTDDENEAEPDDDKQRFTPIAL